MLEMPEKIAGLADKYSTRSVAAGHDELYTKEKGAPYVLMLSQFLNTLQML